ncbi:unnamed protein product [Periconia digitata]|uniref:Uncharacterized protein n=1 Tax=Periconia digitata TaxID=1303443 RepID=A0A9W4XNC3_9PLEO|nr:unnamed protein product [Periconia digitata]
MTDHQYTVAKAGMVMTNHIASIKRCADNHKIPSIATELWIMRQTKIVFSVQGSCANAEILSLVSDTHVALAVHISYLDMGYRGACLGLPPFVTNLSSWLRARLVAVSRLRNI